MKVISIWEIFQPLRHIQALSNQESPGKDALCDAVRPCDPRLQKSRPAGFLKQIKELEFKLG